MINKNVTKAGFFGYRAAPTYCISPWQSLRNPCFLGNGKIKKSQTKNVSKSDKNKNRRIFINTFASYVLVDAGTTSVRPCPGVWGEVGRPCVVVKITVCI